MRSLALFLILATAIPATAHSIFKHPKKWLKDVDQDYREDRNRIVQEGADIITLGSSQREREREQAREAQRRAEEQKQNAERDRQQVTEDKKAAIASLNVTRDNIEKTIIQMTALQRELESGVKAITALVESAKTDRSKLVVVKEIVLSQQSNLIAILSPTDKKLADQIQNHRAQLEKFPVDSVTDDDIDNLSADIGEQYFGTMEQLKQIIESQKLDLGRTSSRIAELENELQELSKK